MIRSETVLGNIEFTSIFIEFTTLFCQGIIKYAHVMILYRLVIKLLKKKISNFNFWVRDSYY